MAARRSGTFRNSKLDVVMTCIIGWLQAVKWCEHGSARTTGARTVAHAACAVPDAERVDTTIATGKPLLGRVKGDAGDSERDDGSFLHLLFLHAGRKSAAADGVHATAISGTVLQVASGNAREKRWSYSSRFKPAVRLSPLLRQCKVTSNPTGRLPSRATCRAFCRPEGAMTQDERLAGEMASRASDTRENAASQPLFQGTIAADYVEGALTATAS
ncbi:hypothetical protein PCL_08358 [Purpureocillium lilacinum]|uniref:Uncharacterized protein n=1 Tax=Purpureocillium lilacinum TaxID=33203 RepID=A0A2U3DRY0_PURLI|nr:hypothetical protein PCL_08358 [Purpureocillium lilacinum]